MCRNLRRAMFGAGVVAIAASVACEKPAPPAPPPPEVYVTAVVQKDVPVYLELVGQTAGLPGRRHPRARRGVPRDGEFPGGLVRQTGRPALHDRSEAARSHRRCRRRRTRPPPRRGSPRPTTTSRGIRHSSPSRRSASRSSTTRWPHQDASRSQVEAAKAAVEKATLDLSYTRVTSPISGLVGTTKVKPGNLVGRGESTLLTTISQIDPVLFKVGVTEADYLRVARQRHRAAGKSLRRLSRRDRADAGRRQSVSAYRPDQHRRARGRPDDRHSGHRAGVFPNPQQLLLAGPIRSRAHAARNQERRAARAAAGRAGTAESVQRCRGATTRKVAFRNVKVGQRVDSLWVIEEGLKPGEQVVVEGLQRIQDGMTVSAKPAPANAGAAAQPPAGRRGEVDHGPLLRQPSHRRDGDLDHHRAARRRRHERPADFAVSRDRAADDPGHHDLHRRQRDRRRGVGRDAARAEDQRRREHDLHEVDQRQRRHVDAEGLVRGRVEPRHEQRAHAEPRVSRACRRCRSRSRTTASR